MAFFLGWLASSWRASPEKGASWDWFGSKFKKSVFYFIFSGVPILTGFISTPGDASQNFQMFLLVASPEMAPDEKPMVTGSSPISPPFWPRDEATGIKEDLEDPIEGLARNISLWVSIGYEIGVLSLKTNQQVPKAVKNWPRPIHLVALRTSKSRLRAKPGRIPSLLGDLSCWETFTWFWDTFGMRKLPRRAFFILQVCRHHRNKFL